MQILELLRLTVELRANTLSSPLQTNARTTAILAVAKANKIDLEIVEADTKNPSADHLKASPLGKIPAFLGEDGYPLSEAIAIAIYSM